MAILTFESDPTPATILLGGAPIGQTPFEHRHLARSLPEVRFERAGRQAVTFTNLQVEAGEKLRVFEAFANENP